MNNKFNWNLERKDWTKEQLFYYFQQISNWIMVMVGAERKRLKNNEQR